MKLIATAAAIATGSVGLICGAVLLLTSVLSSEDPAVAEADKVYSECVRGRDELNAAGLDGSVMTCEDNRARMLGWKPVSERVATAGGQTALIRKCENQFKPLLKDPSSYATTTVT